MELLNVLSQVPAPVLFLVAAIWIIITIIILFQWVKLAKLDGIREFAYEKVLEAEYNYKQGDNEQKLKYVVQQARGLLPTWLQFFLTEKQMMKIIDKWFKGVKDLLDDGKVNKSQAY